MHRRRTQYKQQEISLPSSFTVSDIASLSSFSTSTCTASRDPLDQQCYQEDVRGRKNPPDGEISEARRELETVSRAALDEHRLVAGVDLTPPCQKDFFNENISLLRPWKVLKRVLFLK